MMLYVDERCKLADGTNSKSENARKIQGRTKFIYIEK